MYLWSSFLILLPQSSLPIASYEIKKKRGKKEKRAHPIIHFPVNTSSLEIQNQLCKYVIWQKVQDLNSHL